MQIIESWALIPFALMLLFPFFPDDILCMVAGLTKMPFGFFIVTVCICRTLSIAFMSYFGTGNIIPFHGWGIPVWISLFAIILFFAYLTNYFINKRKTNNKNKK